MNKEELNEANQLYFYDYIIQVLSIAKIGLVFSKDPYALKNYEKLQKVSMEALDKFTNYKFDRSNYFSRAVYPTPNVSVRTCIFNEKNEILLVREKNEGKYDLPGGWCDLYDSPIEAANNECIQEANVSIKNVELIGISSLGTHLKKGDKDCYVSTPHYSILFRADVASHVTYKTFETDDVKYFSLDALPELSYKCGDKELWLKAVKAARDKIHFCD